MYKRFLYLVSGWYMKNTLEENVHVHISYTHSSTSGYFRTLCGMLHYEYTNSFQVQYLGYTIPYLRPYPI